MIITVTYRGPLPSRQRGISPLKRKLRQHFHPQLKAQLEGVLIGRRLDEVTSLVQNQAFVSPAHPVFATGVDLQVLLLSPDLRAGDSDNRLKTLIDGLTRPANEQQLQDHEPPADGGPTYCLLDNDNLVRRISFDARRWHESTDSAESLVVVSAQIVLTEDVKMSSRMPPLPLIF